MIFLYYIVQIVFWYSIGSILALLMIQTFIQKGELIEINGILNVYEDENHPENIAMNDYYSAVGRAGWIIVMSLIFDWIKGVDYE